MLRWLLPLIAVLALLGSSVTAWAAAGTIGDPSCCCPVKADCECHDHDDAPPPAPVLKKCGGDAQLVAPAVVVATLVTPLTVGCELQVAPVVTPAPHGGSDAPTYEPEIPPF